MWVADIFQSFWQFLVEAAPWLLLGFLFAGLLKAFVPSELILRYVGRGNLRSILVATLIGMPLPLCSCGVIPTGVALYRQGASLAATLAFLIATPATTVTAILITLGMLGWKFTVAYMVSAFFIAVSTGLLALVFLRQRPQASAVDTPDSCCESGDGAAEHSLEQPTPAASPRLVDRVKTTFNYGFLDMSQDLGHWILIGLAVAAVISTLVPQSFISEYLGGGLAAMAIMALVAAPIYICSTASVPFVAALIAGGMGPAAGLVFLILGPATNLSTILVIGRTMGRRVVVLYLGSILVLSVVAAYIFDLVGWL